ncbi:hypothetical protein K466DRAFT_328246 [Polyporus arcularius HHB13444]|uniref:Uncharacterized protein n=1 Tax=Polyporus arcularius HHB13444 TaxID=1314778 RepID=A0A5C3NZD5_9APHY|nr:hypothetical protein K466DRAFT_328246 [Polyporus arcularius HHB13444]
MAPALLSAAAPTPRASSPASPPSPPPPPCSAHVRDSPRVHPQRPRPRPDGPARSRRSTPPARRGSSYVTVLPAPGGRGASGAYTYQKKSSRLKGAGLLLCPYFFTVRFRLPDCITRTYSCLYFWAWGWGVVTCCFVSCPLSLVSVRLLSVVCVLLCVVCVVERELCVALVTLQQRYAAGTADYAIRDTIHTCSIQERCRCGWCSIYVGGTSTGRGRAC